MRIPYREINQNDIRNNRYRRLVQQIDHNRMKYRRTRNHSVQTHWTHRIRHSRILIFIGGTLLGCLIAYFSFSFTTNTVDLAKYSVPNSFNVTYYSWITEQELVDEQRRASNVHRTLNNEVRVLCWVLTSPSNHYVKAIHVKTTWGKRCTMLLLMSTEQDDNLGTIALPVTENRKHLWGKTKAALRYIYKHHLNDAEWFLKTDDDTYVVMENLRQLVYPYSSERPIYFGLKYRRDKYPNEDPFATGGSGYVLSREAVRRFVERALPQKEFCLQADTGIGEDVEIARCLSAVNVEFGDSRDAHGRQRFFHEDVENDLMFQPPDRTMAYWRYKVDKKVSGPRCCSDLPVSFHYIQPGQMYVYDYLIYRAHPFGINFERDELPQKFSINP